MATIAVIDDEVPIREVLGELLRAHGHQVVEASDGREGLDLIQRTRPNLVLLDIRMPVMNGAQVLKAVREEEDLCLIPIIVLTGGGDHRQVVECLEAGANDYITKPFNTPELLARMNVQLRVQKLERDLQASEIRHRTLFERSADPMVLLNETGQIVQVNDAAQALLDLNRDRLLSAGILDFVRLSGRPEFEAALIGALEGSRIPIFESHMVPLEGRELPVDIDVHPVEIQDRRHLLLHMRDIRWRKATHAWSSMIFEHIGDAVFIATGQGMILLASRSAAALTGYARGEMVGLDIAQLHPPEVLSRWQGDFLTRLRDGELASYEGLLRRKDGQMVPVEWTLSMFWVDSEEYLIGVARDLTERKSLEAQLRQAQKMEAVGRLAGGVAHEFNNLLQVVMGYSELLLSRLPHGDPAHHQIEEIRKAGGRAASLTRQLLAFSRRQILQPEVLDLNALLSGMDKILRQMLGQRIDLDLTLRPGLGLVRADSAQVEQVVLNLAVNARDAMPEGGRLTVETDGVTLDADYAAAHPEVQPGPHVALIVRDTGEGIAAETLALVFEPFFTTKEQGEGTGLSLAMVYGTVRQSGGSISVSSEPGKGTEFRIYLPRVAEAAEEPPPAETRSSLSTGGEIILMVDDEEMVRRLIAKALELSGYTVLQAASGEEALQVCRGHQGPIHLLVTDVMMPGMTGRELAGRVRVLRPGLKALFVSGYTEDEAIQQGALEVGLAFLQKPFLPDALIRRVRSLLDK